MSRGVVWFAQITEEDDGNLKVHRPSEQPILISWYCCGHFSAKKIRRRARFGPEFRASSSFFPASRAKRTRILDTASRVIAFLISADCSADPSLNLPHRGNLCLVQGVRCQTRRRPKCLWLISFRDNYLSCYIKIGRLDKK